MFWGGVWGLIIAAAVYDQWPSTPGWLSVVIIFAGIAVGQARREAQAAAAAQARVDAHLALVRAEEIERARVRAELAGQQAPALHVVREPPTPIRRASTHADLRRSIATTAVFALAVFVIAAGAAVAGSILSH